MLYKLICALLYLVLAAFILTLVYGAARTEARAIHVDGGGSYDDILDAGYGIIRYQGHTLLVKPEFARTYLDVAWCESKYDERAEGAAGERGFLQIHGLHKARIARLGYTWEQMYEFWPNLIVAYDIWSDSQSWDQWSCGRSTR